MTLHHFLEGDLFSLVLMSFHVNQSYTLIILSRRIECQIPQINFNHVLFHFIPLRQHLPQFPDLCFQTKYFLGWWYLQDPSAILFTSWNLPTSPEPTLKSKSPQTSHVTGTYPINEYVTPSVAIFKKCPSCGPHLSSYYKTKSIWNNGHCALGMTFSEDDYKNMSTIYHKNKMVCVNVSRR